VVARPLTGSAKPPPSHTRPARGLHHSSRRLACLVATIAVLWNPLTAVASEMVDEIVVKYRDDAIPAGAIALPDGDQLDLARALQSGFAAMGRTRDGAFRFALNPPLSVDEANAALNRVRMNRAVLYGEAVREPSSSALRTRIKRARPAPPVVTIIVKYRDGVALASARAGVALPADRLAQMSAMASQPVAHERVMAGGEFLVRLQRPVSEEAALALAAEIALLPDVEYADADLRAYPTLAPNDTFYGYQWHYQTAPVEPGGANLPAAWAITTGVAGVSVAVIDTGILPHPDLAGRYAGGYDFIASSTYANDGSGRDADPTDPGDATPAGFCFSGSAATNSSWHGTHVAGTIGAATNNGAGVAGINWVGKVVPIRVLGRCGGSFSDIADAIVWAAGGAVPGVPANANPARVINMSLGGGPYGLPACPTTLQTAINTAASLGATVVVAAGNDNDDALFYAPSSCNGVITVAATQRQGFRAEYSNFGSLVKIAAPGGGLGTDGITVDFVYSTLNAGTSAATTYNYVGFTGTSMATPHVAGIASLMLAVNPALTPAQMLSRMQTSSRAFPVGAPTCAPAPPDPDDTTWYSCQCTTAICGAGIINATAAVIAAAPLVTNRKLRDFDASGKSDILWRNTATGDHGLWLMDGGLVVDSASFLADLNWQVTHTAFFDADSDADILWRNTATGAVMMWLMNGKAVATSVQLLADKNWSVTHVADFNGDGKADLLWRNALTGETVMWLMDGSSFIGGGTLLSDPAWQITQVGDFNGDGKADVIWRNGATGATVMWLMNGRTQLSGVTLLGSTPWSVTHVGDFNGDGKSDLIWRNGLTGETAVWLMNGTTLSAGAGLLSDPAWSVQKVADLNGDGRADVIWRNGATGEMVGWLMNGLGLSSGGRLLPPGPWTLAAIGDYNGDGRSDLLLKNTITNEVVMWLMNGIAPTAGYTLTTDPHASVTP
jgi:serine protease